MIWVPRSFKKHLISLTMMYYVFLRKNETEQSIYDAPVTL